MEKLSKLLNEYLESKKKDIKQFMNIAALMTQSDSKLYQTYIISKDFEFIKWLVDNDKVDTECQKVLHTARAKAEWIWLECQWYSDYESLLMLLSISNSPIDFLCEILK